MYLEIKSPVNIKQTAQKAMTDFGLIPVSSKSDSTVGLSVVFEKTTVKVDKNIQYKLEKYNNELFVEVDIEKIEICFNNLGLPRLWGME